MSTRELAHEIIDAFTEDQLRGFLLMFGEGYQPEIPNEETLEAIAEVEDMKKHPEKYKGYTDVNEMMKELLA